MRAEQVRERDLLDGAVGALEAIVLGETTSERELAPLRSDGLDLAAERHLQREELVALRAVVVRLVRKAVSGHDHSS